MERGLLREELVAYRIKPEDVPVYRKTMRRVTRSAERTAPELFRWLGWSTALAAVQVVAIRTGSTWLKFVPFVFAAFISGRIQWFLGLKHPELQQQDGSLIIRFQPWRMLFIPIGWALTWAVAVGAANLIARSDLLPQRATPAASKPSVNNSVGKSPAEAKQ